MTFLKSFFTNNSARREQLQRYVDMEYRPEERHAALEILMREANK